MPCAAVFVAADGDANLLGVTRQLVGEEWLGARGFQYAGSIGPWPASQAVLRMIRHVGRVLAQQFQLSGLFGVDMVLDGEQAWVLEVNPRYTASVEIVERATGVHAIAEHAAACGELGTAQQRAGPSPALAPQSGVDDDPARGGSHVHGKAILFAKRDVAITQSFGEAALAEALQSSWPSLADVSPPGTFIETGRPILTMFASGSSVEDVERRLMERSRELESLIYSRPS